MGIYGFYFLLLIFLFATMLIFRPGSVQRVGNAKFRRFQYEFLTAFLTMFAGDWLQGPTVYALYAYYGFSRTENGILFIVGFGSSMLLGPFTGALADRYGRRLICISYGIIYSLCCVTKHFNNFGLLLLGRLFGGVATSIVWSGFESWMVSEHRNRGFDDEWLGDTFSLMTVGNGIIAIPAGFIAQVAVWAYEGHPVAPFDVALTFLVLGCFIILLTWKENYGDCTFHMVGGLQDATIALFGSTRMLLLGGVQSLYESSMYIFIFIWTPALEEAGPIPHGIIFSCFMICCSLGAFIFSTLMRKYPVLIIMESVFLVSAVCLAVPIFTTKPAVLMPTFCLYELMIGIFWPGIGTLRSEYLPEKHRTTIMNLYRIPLNFLVMAVLLYQGSMTIRAVFGFCVVFQLLCVILQYALIRTAGRTRSHKDLEHLMEHNGADSA